MDVKALFFYTQDGLFIKSKHRHSTLEAIDFYF